MEKKRSKGITTVAILKILYGIIIFIFTIFTGLAGLATVLGIFGKVLPHAFFVLYIIAVANILRLKEHGRKLSIALDIVLLLSNLIFILPNEIKYSVMRDYRFLVIEGFFILFYYLLPVWFVFFLTRPKVKEQFK